jgi:opacity protein-like surface antigen
MTVLRQLAAFALTATLFPIGTAHTADLLSPYRAPPTPIFAPTLSGFYIGGRQGLSVSDKTKFSSATGGGTSFETTYELGRQMGLVGGYSFGPMFGIVSPRLEIEGSFANPEVRSHTTVQGGVNISQGKTDSFGSLVSYTGLANAYLDLNLGRSGFGQGNSWMAKITPFIGAGIGASNVTLRKQGISATGVTMDSSATRLTWQISTGISYQIFEKTQLEIGYRHQRTEGLSFTSRDGTVSKTNLVNNMVTMGIRRSF